MRDATDLHDVREIRRENPVRLVESPFHAGMCVALSSFSLHYKCHRLSTCRLSCYFPQRFCRVNRRAKDGGSLTAVTAINVSCVLYVRRPDWRSSTHRDGWRIFRSSRNSRDTWWILRSRWGARIYCTRETARGKENACKKEEGKWEREKWCWLCRLLFRGQYEKSKPLVNLVDNMVKLGSLYNRNTANGTSNVSGSRHDLVHENARDHRDRLEFNQRVQEQRLLAEERRDWDRLSPDHGQLQVSDSIEFTPSRTCHSWNTLNFCNEACRFVMLLCFLLSSVRRCCSRRSLARLCSSC